MPDAEKTAIDALNWYEHAEPKLIAETVVPLVQLEQDLLLITAGTLHPNPITIRVTSLPLTPIFFTSGWIAKDVLSNNPVDL